MSTGTHPFSILWNYVPRAGIDYDESNLFKALNYIREDQDISEIKEIGQGTFDNITGQIDRMVDIALDQYRLLLEFLDEWDYMPSISVTRANTTVGRQNLPAMDWTPYAVASVPPAIAAPADIAPVVQVDVEEPEYDEAPYFDAIGQFPELDFTGEPILSAVAEPGEPPSLQFLDLPAELPDLEMPVLPTLHDVELPPALDVNFPVFLGEQPDVTAIGDAPANFSYFEPEYLSTLFDTVCGKLISDLNTSSSGIDPTVEQALYDRAVDKLNLETDKQQQDVEDYFVSKGFTMPAGVLSGRILEIQSSKARAHQNLLNDIVVQRSNLVQQNIQALISGAIQLDGILRQTFDSIQNRNLESQKQIFAGAITLYNARVDKFKSEIEAYKVDSEVFKNMIQSESIKVDAYKAQVEAAKVSAEVRESLVRAYLAELESVRTLVDVYKTRIETVKAWADAERAKLDAYKAEVEAYATRMSANEITWRMYDTKIKAQGTKAGAYGELVKAYQTSTDAWRTKVQVEADKARLVIDQNNLRLNKYQADIQKYQQDVATYLGRINAHVQVEDLRVKNSGVNADGAKKELDAKAQNEALRIDEAKIKSSEAVAYMQTQVSVTLEQWKANIELLKTKGNMLAQIAASALSTFNTNMNYGHSSSFSGSLSRSHGVSHSEGSSWNQSVSNNWSRSHSDGRSESWIYNVE